MLFSEAVVVRGYVKMAKTIVGFVGFVWFLLRSLPFKAFSMMEQPLLGRRQAGDVI